MTIDQVSAIERQIELRASPERVWRALTEPEEIRGWFGQSAELDLRPGGSGRIDWDEHGSFFIRVEAVEPTTYLAWRWAREPGVPVEDGPSTLVEFRLDPRPDGGTLLALRESGFERASDRETNVEGWTSELNELVTFLDGDPWRAGIQRRIVLRADPDTVWRAFADMASWGAWWGPIEGFEPRVGSEGWFVWPAEGGRFAGRIETFEPANRRFAWRWATVPETALEAASSTLLTEWSIEPGEDGGSILSLRETGFDGRRNWDLNRNGWETDMFPAIRRHLGEGST
jgi:uncharacterized protein YndB with AHSA1/START domain